MSDRSFTFNWHEQPEGFLKWAYITLMANIGEHDELMEATEGGRSIELSVHANGIELSAARLMESLEQNYKLAVQRGIEAKIQEAGLEALSDDLYKAEKAVRAVFKAKFKKLGIEWEEREEW